MPPVGSESPRQVESDASVASHSRAAFCDYVSNTGWISVGELAITPKISLVAVCCSSASVSSRLRACCSLNKPCVLNRDHRLIGEGFEQLDLPVRERTDLSSANMNSTDGHTFT